MTTKVHHVPYPFPKINLCGCFSLRTGAMIVAWYTAVMYTIVFITLMIIEVILYQEARDHNLNEEESRVFMVMFTPIILILIVRAILLIASVMLLKGVIEANPQYMMPWITIKVISITSDIFSLILDIFITDFKQAGIDIIRIGFTAYLFSIIYSYFNLLQDTVK